MNELERRFHRAMLTICERAQRECNYNPLWFRRMLSDYGGVKTAKRLLARRGAQSGFTRLQSCGRLDLTVEAHVLRPEFRSLFAEDERREARDRLAEVDPEFVAGLGG